MSIIVYAKLRVMGFKHRQYRYSVMLDCVYVGQLSRVALKELKLIELDPEGFEKKERNRFGMNIILGRKLED